MESPVYFTKVEFAEKMIYGNIRSVILLNLVEKILMYQVYDWKQQLPVRVIRNAKTEYKPQLLACELYESDVIFSHVVNLTDNQMRELFPYCNALSFEPYRNREMSMEDVGYIGYRDEVIVEFTAVTDSYLPKIELPMSYYYDEKHIWPSEKLYRYLIGTYLNKDKNKKLRKFGPTYFGCSQFT